jgi:hypothetical protein
MSGTRTTGPGAPLVLRWGEERLTVVRGWPGAGGERILECRDGAGRLRAARLAPDPAAGPGAASGEECAPAAGLPAGPAAEACGRLEVLPYGRDPRLRSLRPDGELLVHRAGKRAVVRTADGFVKHLRRGRAAGVAQATAETGGLAAGAGFAVPRVVAADEDSVTLSAVPGTALLDLSGADWARAWDRWARLWPRLVLTPVPPAGLGTHDAADEAEVVAGWSAHVRESDPGRFAHRLRAQLRSIEARTRDALLSLGDGRTAVVAHRDLHDGQMLFDAGTGGLGLLDFDTAVAADRELDLGNLDVHVDLRVAQGLVDHARAAVAHAAIERAADAVEADAHRLDVYRRAARARLVGVYAFRPQWAGLAARMAEDLARDV